MRFSFNLIKVIMAPRRDGSSEITGCWAEPGARFVENVSGFGYARCVLFVTKMQHPFNLSFLSVYPSPFLAFLWSTRDRICLAISQVGPATGVLGASFSSWLQRSICYCQPSSLHSYVRAPDSRVLNVHCTANQKRKMLIATMPRSFIYRYTSLLATISGFWAFLYYFTDKNITSQRNRIKKKN